LAIPILLFRIGRLRDAANVPLGGLQLTRSLQLRRL